MSRAEYSSMDGKAGRRPALVRLAAAAVGVSAAALLAGCGTGQVTQTANEESVVNGASATIGQIAIRDAQLAPAPQPHGYYSSGSDAPLIMTIVNTGSANDKLLSVSSPDAAGVDIAGSRMIVGGTAVTSGENPNGSASGSSATPNLPGTSGPHAPHSHGGVKPGSSLPIGQIRITLTGLKVDQLRSGYAVPVVFTFANAGKVTVPMPVGVPGHEAPGGHL